MHGYGKITTFNGKVIFEGYHKNGEKHGHVRFEIKENMIYDGEYQDGKMNGEGKVYDKHGNLRIDGYFVNNLQTGYGMGHLTSGKIYRG